MNNGPDKGTLVIGMRNGEELESIVQRSLFDQIKDALVNVSSGTIVLNDDRGTVIVIRTSDISYARFKLRYE